MIDTGVLPPAPNDERCPKCSLIESCLPAVVARNAGGRAYRRLLFDIDEQREE
jgi:hypothetical protein